MGDKIEEEMIVKSFEQMKHYLNLVHYKTTKKIDLNKIRKETVLFPFTHQELKDEPIVYLIYCYSSSNFNKTNLEKEISNVKELRKQDTLLIVTKDYSTSTIHDLLRSKYYDYYINIYKIQQLQYNILEHSFVPKHIKLNATEKIELYKTFHVNDDSQMPQISRFDPVACAIFLRPGEVCKIIRYDKISFENEFYRVCIG
jgi:DNA-directed RNA polymerase subunit H (RpoH/RPB5)